MDVNQFIKEAKSVGGFYVEHTSPANGGIRAAGEKYISVGHFLEPERPLSITVVEHGLVGVNREVVLNFTPFQIVGGVAPKTWRGTLNELISAMK